MLSTLIKIRLCYVRWWHVDRSWWDFLRPPNHPLNCSRYAKRLFGLLSYSLKYAHLQKYWIIIVFEEDLREKWTKLTKKMWSRWHTWNCIRLDKLNQISCVNIIKTKHCDDSREDKILWWFSRSFNLFIKICSMQNIVGASKLSFKVFYSRAKDGINIIIQNKVWNDGLKSISCGTVSHLELLAMAFQQNFDNGNSFCGH